MCNQNNKIKIHSHTIFIDLEICTAYLKDMFATEQSKFEGKKFQLNRKKKQKTIKKKKKIHSHTIFIDLEICTAYLKDMFATEQSKFEGKKFQLNRKKKQKT